MKLTSIANTFFLLLQYRAHAFSVDKTINRGRGCHAVHNSYLDVLSATPENTDAAATVATKSPRKKPLSPQEILAKQRELRGETEDDEYPKLFDDEILDNIRQVLLTLEKRAKDGPNSLSILEVEEFIAMSQSVQKEMKEKELLRLEEASKPPVPAAVTPPPPPPHPVATPQPRVVATPPTPVATPPSPEVVKSNDVTAEQENREDGPAYDPRGGQGSLAKGTRNTYVIPNMDAMSPEEYQKALQENVIREQAERRKKIGAGYGNRATWDYLNNLTGESGVLKKDELEQ
jgi:hypothetical protein